METSSKISKSIPNTNNLTRDHNVEKTYFKQILTEKSKNKLQISVVKIKAWNPNDLFRLWFCVFKRKLGL